MSKAYDLAKKFYEDEWNDEATKIHSDCVISLALQAAPYFDLNTEVFEIAGWIHDLGRKDDPDEHPKLSLNYLDKFLELYPEYKPLKEEISDCILNHGRKTIQKTKYGKIMQLCDSASMRHKKWLKYVKKIE